MTKTIVFFLVMVALQIILSSLVEPISAVPNLFFVVAAWIVLFRPETNYIYIPALGGLFLDLYSPDFFGFNFLLLFLVAFLLRSLVRTFIRPNPGLYTQAIFTFLAVLIFNFIGAGIYSIMVSMNLASGYFVAGFLNPGLILELGYSLILAVPVSLFAERMLKPSDLKKFSI